jgi:hypothetical protein
MTVSYTFLNTGPNGITPLLRCPRCQGPVKVGIYAAPDNHPMMIALCASVGTACATKKLTDYPLALEASRIQMDINVREIVRRFQQALAVIIKLRDGTGDVMERLAGAIHVAESAMQGVVPVEDRSIGSPEQTEAAVDIARGLVAGRPAADVAPHIQHYPRSCSDCGIKVMAPKSLPGDPPILCGTCHRRHINNAKAKEMFAKESISVTTPKLDERSCILCGAPVILPPGSEETPVCPPCQDKATNEETKENALPPPTVAQRCAICGAGGGEPCATNIPHPKKAMDFPLPKAPTAGESPTWKLYGYSSEEEYYSEEWGGAACPACGATLDASGRKHENPEADEECAKGSMAP